MLTIIQQTHLLSHKFSIEACIKTFEQALADEMKSLIHSSLIAVPFVNGNLAEFVLRKSRKTVVLVKV